MCREIKNTNINHVCVEETIQTVSTLRRDTKPCPNCAIPITKIDGCDQMWCTECKTAFSWNTGRVEEGRIHNPHFYEWQRTHGTIAPVPEDVQCEGLRQFYTYNYTITSVDVNRDIYRKIIELEQDVIPRINVKWDNSKLRLEYLLGKIDIHRFANRLQKRERIYKGNLTNVQCLKLYCQLMTDMFNSGKIDLGQENELRKYVNTTIRKAERLYGVECVQIEKYFYVKKVK